MSTHGASAAALAAGTTHAASLVESAARKRTVRWLSASSARGASTRRGPGRKTSERSKTRKATAARTYATTTMTTTRVRKRLTSAPLVDSSCLLLRLPAEDGLAEVGRRPASTAPGARTRIPALEALLHELVSRRRLALGMMVTHVRDVPVVIGRANDRAYDARGTTQPAGHGVGAARRNHSADRWHQRCPPVDGTAGPRRARCCSKSS